MLVLTTVVTLVMLVVVATELRQKATPSGTQLVLIILTLIFGWLFSNLVYTFHYAFLYYSGGVSGGDHRGLEFPERPEPDYWDFRLFRFHARHGDVPDQRRADNEPRDPARCAVPQPRRICLPPRHHRLLRSTSLVAAKGPG